MPAYGISWHIWPLYSYTKWVDSELVFQKTTYWPVAKVRSFPWIGDRNMVFNSGSNNQEHDNVWHWPMIGKWTFISHWRRLRFIYLKWQRFDVYQLFVAQVVCWLCCVRLRRQQYSWCVVTYEWSCNQPTQQRLSCLRPTPTWTGCLKNTTYGRRKIVLHLFISEPLVKQSLVESAKCFLASETCGEDPEGVDEVQMRCLKDQSAISY